MSKKNRGATSRDEQTVATEAIPLADMTREQMLEHVRAIDPKIDASEFDDNELREFVASFAPPAEGPVEGDEGEEQEEPVAEHPAVQEFKEAVIAADGTDWSGIPPAARKIIEDLQSQIAAVKNKGARKAVASGSKARPNVIYTLLAKPPAWHSTPQVAQIEQILFDDPAVAQKYVDPADGLVKIPEPEVFALIEAGQKKGVLRTRQNPVRIFQYYRSKLLNHNVLRWK